MTNSSTGKEDKKTDLKRRVRKKIHFVFFIRKFPKRGKCIRKYTLTHTHTHSHTLTHTHTHSHTLTHTHTLINKQNNSQQKKSECTKSNKKERKKEV